MLVAFKIEFGSDNFYRINNLERQKQMGIDSQLNEESFFQRVKKLKIFLKVISVK